MRMVQIVVTVLPEGDPNRETGRPYAIHGLGSDGGVYRAINNKWEREVTPPALARGEAAAAQASQQLAQHKPAPAPSPIYTPPPAAAPKAPNLIQRFTQWPMK